MVDTSLELSINTLKNYTLTMIKRCEEVVYKSIECMVKKDLDGAKKVIKQDDEIDTLRAYIRDRSIELMALKQPMAKDLRYIYALGNIALDLERIGDYAVNISQEVLSIGEEPYIKELVDITKMSEICCNMLKDIYNALENQDEKLCYKVAKKDDNIDNLYKNVHSHCLEVMNQNIATINQGVRLLFIGRYLERIGDHSTNICEKIIYAIKGDMVEIG